eukprot:2391263-Rhodomonas_salina.2
MRRSDALERGGWQVGGQLMLLDQHAADERIRLEKILAALAPAATGRARAGLPEPLAVLFVLECVTPSCVRGSAARARAARPGAVGRRGGGAEPRGAPRRAPAARSHAPPHLPRSGRGLGLCGQAGACAAGWRRRVPARWGA